MKNIQPEIKYIPIGSIKPNPYQPRKDFNQKSLEELSQSIKSFGLIQPISVRKIYGDSYELIAGERRLRASELAELENIPAIIVEYKDKDSAMIALIENLQREDLNFIEEAEGYNNLILDHSFTQQELAEKMGKSQSTIANKLRLLKLPDDIKKDLLEYNLTERHGRALLKLPDDDLKRNILDKVIKNELNVSRTEALVEDILDDLTKTEEKESRQNIKSLISIRIYLNTIKKAYSAIKESGVEAQYVEKDKGDHVEVTVKIPKK
ncbi:nucleoid occlusion protein [Tissierella sp. MSJ-40]|uniref:Nucleoid occlusion protein n=1 Tax=Tissierella simiarum TaxID=2841534 RepID=A0ABS6E6W0_9FIRM|nr:nucleoid occlusion protein [Tissierella simiarum]MBU5437979.1 nucleoid occlusion protein [Tissierella simiarum]